MRFDRVDRSALAFEVIDDGMGLFNHLRTTLGFESDLHALQELSKGKLTTLPAGHTGDGIFFTSKAARGSRSTAVACDGSWTTSSGTPR